MGIIKSKFKKMEEFDCSVDDVDGKMEMNFDPRSPTLTITRTPVNEFRAKNSLITRGANLANISTPINSDLLLIQDKRFKHLAHSFIDPRSPSEGIVRTPIVIKSTDISSIVNTPRILEEDYLGGDQEDNDDEAFQKTFEEALSKMSFDDYLGDEGQENRLPNPIETHFDCILDQKDHAAVQAVQPLKPMAVVTNLITQSTLDPRSPTIGIDRTPLVFGNQERKTVQPTLSLERNFAEQLLMDDGEGGEEEKEVEKEDRGSCESTEEATTKETQITEQQQAEKEKQNEDKQKSAQVFVDVGHVIYGTPVQVGATSAPIQQVRTPLSCLANRKRVDLNAPSTKSPMSQNKKQHQLQPNKENRNELEVKRTTNPFETAATRKLIR